jgi:hypothetical protein
MRAPREVGDHLGEHQGSGTSSASDSLTGLGFGTKLVSLAKGTYLPASVWQELHSGCRAWA